jgi:ubiquinone/menaquinone biosynthesis C-methylase UbiE
MTSPETPRIDQLTYWNGTAAQHWTDLQETLDVTFAPILQELLTRSAVAPGERVIDVGCGCGASSIALGERVGSNGDVLGIDISTDMLTRARERTPATAPVTYLLADASRHSFTPGHFDLLFSRFGVMFFEEPARAFTNLAGAMRVGGRLTFACWRTPRDNPWFMLPLQEALKFVPRLPELGPEDPGPFSFASEERVTRILTQAGFSNVTLAPLDLTLDLAARRGLDHALTMALSIGPAARALEGQPQDKVAAATQAIRDALSRHAEGNSVNLVARIWIVTATKG